MAKINFWLLKSEPNTWSWQDQKQVATEKWDGVRNYQARNNLRAMKEGDLAFFYHSVNEKRVVGIVRIVKEHYPDSDPNFSCVDVEYFKDLKRSVSLKEIKDNERLAEIGLVKQSRLSVVPLKKEEFEEILKMAETSIN